MSIFQRIAALFKRPAAAEPAKSAPAFGTPSQPPAPRTASLTRRIARVMENIHGDEGLTGDLTDPAAKLLLSFAEQEVNRMAEDTRELDDDTALQALGTRVQELRSKLRQAARESAKTEDPLCALQNKLAELRSAQPLKKE